MFKTGFPEEFSTLKKLAWLYGSGTGISGDSWITLTGDIVRFMASRAAPFRKLSTAIEPVQDLHGYDNPWPAGGGKNKFNPDEAQIGKRVNSTTGLIEDATSEWWVSGYIPVKSGDVVRRTQTGTTRQSFFNADKSSATYVGGNDGGTAPEDGFFVLSGMVSTIAPTGQIIVTINNEDLTFQPYSNICPISGHTECNVTRTGKNLLGGHDLGQAIVNAVGDTSISDFGSNSDGDYVTVSTGTDTSRKMFTNGIKFKENTQYTFFMRLSKYVAGSMLSSNFCFEYNDGTVSPIVFDEVSSTEVVTLRTTTLTGKTLSGISTGFYSGTSYLFYEDSGIFEGGLTVEEFEEYRGTTYPITFPSGTGTVYGGNITVNQDGSGTLVVDKANVDLGTLNWTHRTDIAQGLFATDANAINYRYANNTTAICSSYRYRGTATAAQLAVVNKTCSLYYSISSPTKRAYICDTAYSDAATFKTAMSGVQLVYELATPITIPLTASQITTLLGQNNVWANTGTVTVEVKGKEIP